MKPALRKILRYAAIVLLLLFVTSFCYALYLRWFPPVTTPLMVMRALGPKEKDDWQLHARWRAYDNISANAKLAVIASEDQNFAFHHGFDYEAIEKAMEHNKKSKKVRGASTISQQVAKNVFLWPGRSWVRKGFEVYFTFLIETLWSKERILTMYLNVAEMGDGIFGVEAASQRYFKKPAARLNPAQGAMLAAILPNPRKYNALKPSSYVRGRQQRIQRFMRGIGGTAYLKNL